MSPVPHLVLYVLVCQTDPSVWSVTRGINGDFIQVFPELPTLGDVDLALAAYKLPAPTVSKQDYDNLILGEQVQILGTVYRLIKHDFLNYYPTALKSIPNGNTTNT